MQARRGGRRAFGVLMALALGSASAACAGGGGGTEEAVDALLAAGERMPAGMELSSTAFDDGEPVPQRFSCEGENVPPPLRWKGAPAGTKELALVIEDPEAPEGIFVQWLVVGIQPTVTNVGPAGPPPGAEVLPGSSDNPTYIGPCPPNGDDPHSYVFQVYALAGRPRLDAASTPVAKVRAVRKAATAGGVLVGTFER